MEILSKYAYLLGGPGAKPPEIFGKLFFLNKISKQFIIFKKKFTISTKGFKWNLCLKTLEIVNRYPKKSIAF